MQFLANLLILVQTTTVCYAAFGPKKLYSMDVPTTAVSVKVIGKDLLIVGPWYIGSVTNVHWKFRQPSRMTPRIVNKDIPNPRAVGKVPSNAFSGNKALTYWVSTWGANGTTGAIYVLRPTTTYSVWKDITIDAGWNYERSQWVDMNKDGRVDCLTARFRGGVGQLLWFQQPKGQDKWGQQIIHEGMADGNFIGFVKGRKTYILVAGLQFSSLGLYWTMHRGNLWSNNRLVRQRVVDNYGKYYDVQYIDLNRDGRPDVLTTTVNIGNSRGHVLGYEVPDDIQNKVWKRRVLAAGFQGDYSPGKATAFWPNKWKRKTDRPSIFLSGAGQEILFILTPKPARSGWSYIKSSLRAGTGMIGIPYIRDIDGDSYPEVFVPQGNKLHVFSYDYNAAVAEPPKTPSTSGRSTARPVVRFMPPFFRPGLPIRPPVIPQNRSSVASIPSAGGLSGEAATRFGSSGVLPSSDSATQTVAPLGNLPPFVPRGGNAGNTRPANPQRSPTNDRSSSVNPVGSQAQPNNGANVILRPIMTNDGLAFVPVTAEAPQNEPSAQPSQQENQPIIPWSPPNEGTTGQSNENEVNSDGFNGNEIIPYDETQDGGSESSRSPMEPVFEDEINDYEYDGTQDPDNYDWYHGGETPMNLILSITSESYRYQEEAADACSFEKKVLCSLMQLESAMSAGQLPLIEWGWFDMPGRAAEIKDCIPGDIRWQGFKCHNGIIGHAPVQQSTSLKGYCCSVMRGANITDRKYSNNRQAEVGCQKLGHRICSLDDMYKVWEKSSYKSDTWGWYQDDQRLIKMVHNCIPNRELWPGYQCLRRRLVTSDINTNSVQEKAYCCHTSSSLPNAQPPLYLMTIMLSCYVAIFAFI